ncbi:hypothetical protein PMI41_00080 [Phyllobacterium sp. YR531]|nr:hypothetical protein PMI41_00080 [Phyllobacterium sp. YR531]
MLRAVQEFCEPDLGCFDDANYDELHKALLIIATDSQLNNGLSILPRMDMRLILDLAITHIAGRGRQTLVAIVGVAVGVGFSIAMAALMQGGHDDFVEQLINAMPHVEISDEHRTSPLLSRLVCLPDKRKARKRLT